MGQPIDRAGIEAAWRALAGTDGDGSRSIPVGSIANVRVRAGRRFPGNEETVLFGIAGYRRPPNDQLPNGRGFDVSPVTLHQEEPNQKWIGISRERAGNLDLFSMMITDVIGHLETVASGGGDCGSALLSRVKAWQDFMQRSDGALGAEEEIGLVGELHTVLGMLALGVAPDAVVEAWRGPLDSLHDFVFPRGVIEVKSSIATVGFIASIASLEQLDDLNAAPLALVAVRLAISDQGTTLPELVQMIRSAVTQAGPPEDLFEARLLHAGYSDRFAGRYVRRFSHVSSKVYVVDSGFPRLVHGNVPTSVRQARYDLDLAMLDLPTLSLGQALALVGAN
jgi:hypothetical protein